MQKFQELALYDLEECRLRIREGYELREQGRCLPLKRWLWRKAISWGFVQPHFEDTVRYRRIAVRVDVMPDEILKAVEAVYSFGQQPKEILMGPMFFRKVMKQPAIRDTDAFSIALPYEVNRRLFGLPLHVLPWMEGMLVR